MAVQVTYDQDCRMHITGVDCDCGCAHHSINKDIYIGKGLIARVPEYITRRNLGSNCVLVADDNTYRVAGADVEKALADYRAKKNGGSSFDVDEFFEAALRRTYN